MAGPWAPAPSYSNYADFLQNMIGGIPGDIRQTQSQQNVLQQQQLQLEEEKRRQAQQTAFSSGVPMVNGQPDYAAILQKQAGLGNINAITSLGPLALEQQQRAEAAKGSSLLNGAPPASAAANVSTGSGASSASPASANGRTVDAIVSSSLPSGSAQEKTVAANIAKVLKVDPTADLTPEQADKARRYVASYAQRKGVSALTDTGGSLPLFAAAGAQYGISPDFLARSAQIESGMNPNAKNPNSTAKGLFEFTDSTAKKYGLTNPYDPVASTDAAARLAADNRDALTKSLGRAPTDAELYLAHQQGAGGAAKLLLNPDEKASSIVGMKAVIQNGGKPNMTAGQFAQMWLNRYGSGGDTLNFNPMAMRQPIQGVATPAGTSGAVPAFPQIAPQPQSRDFQALAPSGSMTGFRAAAGVAPQPIQTAQGGAPAAQAPQQPVAPAQDQPQPLVAPVPLPKGFNDPQQAILAIDREIAKLSVNPYAKGEVAALTDWRDRIAAQTTPIQVHPGTALVDPRTGKTVFQSGSALLDDPTISQMAAQYRAGDTSVMQNLGRGEQGAENIVKLRREISRQNAEAGTTGADQAIANAEFFGTKAGERTLGTRQANIELAATEFKQVLPVVRDASAQVSRTNYPDFNRIIQAGETHTGDSKIVAFGSGVNTLVNLYSRAISPTGVPTVADKEHARELLSAAWSQGQFDAATGMMEREINAALNSPQKVRAEMRQRFGSNGAKEGGGESSGAQSGAPAKIATKAEFDALPSGTEFIAPDGSHRRKP